MGSKKLLLKQREARGSFRFREGYMRQSGRLQTQYEQFIERYCGRHKGSAVMASQKQRSGQLRQANTYKLYTH